MSLQSIVTRALTIAAKRVVLPGYDRRFAKFRRLTERSRENQRELLLRWLSRCRDTRFGRDHGFAELTSVNDFRRRVPVSKYDYFAPYIDAVGRGEFSALFPPEEKVGRFTITTGSTGKPKLNPVTPTWLKYYREAWDLWGGKMLLDHPEKVGRKILHIIGSWDMGRTEAGIPISMVSALLARNQHPLVRPFYAVPNEVTDIRDPVGRYYATLRLSMAEPIGLIVVMNPGTLLRLAQLGNEHRESLIRDIHDGTLSTRFDVPDAIRKQIAPRIRANPARARELEQFINKTGRLYPGDYWEEPLIACWLGGTAGYQAKYLNEYFGAAPLRDQGLVSSEGRHTIPVVDTKPEGVLSINSAFYEFIPVEDTSANPTALEAHELQLDRDYHIVMTTYSGYFRFHIGDMVRCRGYFGQAPLLEFLQKSERCCDLEGEKVTEHQFLDAAAETAREQGIRLGPVTAMPSRIDRKLPCYRFIIEQGDVPEQHIAQSFLQGVDQRLRATNFLYSARRRERVLGPPLLTRIKPGGWARYVQSEIERRGTGEAHYKHSALVQDTSLLDRLEVIDEIEMAEPSA